MSELSRVNLSKTCNWSFAQVEGEKQQDAKDGEHHEWFDIKQGDMPTSVHVELMKQGVIKDPYKGMNEYDVQVSLDRVLVHSLD
jgi:hypothetical protein